MPEAWIIDGVRSPRGRGKPGKGGLAHLHPQRNMAQVLGAKLDKKAKVMIAYTPNGAAMGGTGQAIRVSEALEIPVLNMRRPAIREAVMKELGLSLERGVHKVVSTHRSRAEPAPKPKEAPARRWLARSKLNVAEGRNESALEQHWLAPRTPEQQTKSAEMKDTPQNRSIQQVHHENGSIQ